MSRDEAKAIIEKLVERFAEHRKDYHLPDYNEQKTRQDFINPFFKALGWDIDNEKGDSEAYREVIYEDKVVVKGKAKAPDYGFRLAGSATKRLFYVEAKKPSVPVKTHKESAYQLRRYGSSAQAHVSVLTNFEDFNIYDCSKVPNVNDSATVARLKHIHFEDYVKDFDYIYDIFSHEAVTKGRFDKFVQSAANKKGTDTLDKRFVQSLDEWRTYLAKNIALNNKKINDEELNFAVQLLIDRLIFLRFCEDRAVEPDSQLLKAVSKGDSYKNLLHLFEEADHKYNSGLFDFKKDVITPHLKLDNKILKQVMGELYYPACSYDFRVMPVEVLGNAYEQFLGKVIRITPARSVKIEEKPEVRKAGGVYYTPQYIVDYIVKNTVGKLIEGKTPKEVEKIKIVDPACGSGSFLVGAFHYLLDWHTDYYYREQKRLTDSIETNGIAAKEKTALIKERGTLPLTPDGKLTTKIKKQILVNNIYGVDLDANAVEVSKLSLLLKCMEGETEASIKTITLNLNDRVLPNLDENIKDGNSLIDTDIYDSAIDLGYEKKIKPFSWAKGFSEVFKQGGFDIVIGNPPYSYMISKEQQEYFSNKYKYQDYQKDLYLLFLERYKDILRNQGYLSVIISNTWLQSVTLKKIRTFLSTHYEWIKMLLLPMKVFDAVVDTHVIVFRNQRPSKKTTIEIEVLKDRIIQKSHIISHEEINSNGEPINVSVNSKTKFLFEKIIKRNNKLSDFCKVYNGVKPFEKGKGKPPQTEITMKEKPFVVEGTKPNNKWSPLLRGSLMNRYVNNWKQNYWILYGEWLAAPRDKNIFLNDEMIVVRQTGDSLVATIIQKGFFSRDNLHIIIPHSTNSKYLLGLINSKLLDSIYTYINPEKGEALAQVKKLHVEILPIKKIDEKNKLEKSAQDEIIKYVDSILKLNEEIKEEKLPNKIEQLKQRIEHSEEKINQLVYELYELTPEEIKIVEGGTNE